MYSVSFRPEVLMPHRPSRKQVARTALIAGLTNLPAELFAHGHFTSDDLARLQTRLVGTAVTKSSEDYDKDRQVSSPVFQKFPVIIVYCQVFEDVWYSLEFAHAHDLRVVCRCGGHNTAGFSVATDAMVIDTSPMSYVAVDPSNRIATVGSGTQLGALNSTLDFYQMHTPGGACRDVGTAGHMMGGGYGWTCREFGMHCDNVVEVLVMLADGRIVRANETLNPDLFWGIRGGTGNNFGVLLESKYRLHDLWQVWGFGLSWPLEGAAPILLALQQDFMLNAAPRELGFQVPWLTHGGEKMLLMRGVYHGPADEGRKLLEPLMKFPGATREIDQVGKYLEINDLLVEGLPDVPPHATEDKASGYVAKELDKEDWELLIEAAQKDETGFACGNFEVYGGTINDLPKDSNAFIHRDVYFNWFQDVFWVDDEQKPEAEKFLKEMVDAWTPHFNGHANQDYPHVSQPDYRWPYFGDAFNTLLWVKQKYDPHDFFHFEQSISPYPSDYDGPRDTTDPLFSDSEIVAEPYSRRFGGGDL